MTPASPPGGEAGPSRWSERLPLVGGALLGLAIATTLALYQWGILSDVWEPFFGSGSRVILHSSLSRLLPIPDAALGAFGYLAEAVLGLVGGTERYRKQPGLVLLMGLTVGVMGAAGLLLIGLQVFLYRQFCTLCLASAFLSLGLIPLAWPEVRAALRSVIRRHT